MGIKHLCAKHQGLCNILSETFVTRSSLPLWKAMEMFKTQLTTYNFCYVSIQILPLPPHSTTCTPCALISAG